VYTRGGQIKLTREVQRFALKNTYFCEMFQAPSTVTKSLQLWRTLDQVWRMAIM